MDGLIFLAICIVVALTLGAASLVSHRRAERLDSEVTAYVAEGSLSAETARGILESEATTARKRQVAALIAEGMEPEKGLALLDAMATA